MIGRGPVKASQMLAVSVLTAGLVAAGFINYPSSALAKDTQPIRHVITFQSNGSVTQHSTDATTVGDFLRTRGIVVSHDDYLHPSPEVPLSDHLIIDYRAAVPVTIVTASGSKKIRSPAEDVGALLEEQGLALGKYDVVYPSLSDRIVANSTVRVTRITRWVKTEKHVIAQQTVHRIVFSMPPGAHKIIAHGHGGVRETMVRLTQRDNGKVQRQVVGSRILRKPQPRIVAEGLGEFAAFEHSAGRGLQHTSYITASAMSMEATAYTAGCYGCSGITALGYHAGHGIVAVDPRVIPLGSRLYIPGYGFALAGDTGGAIVGNRIDLGFNSLRDAVQFGRRYITVYRLR